MKIKRLVLGTSIALLALVSTSSCGNNGALVEETSKDEPTTPKDETTTPKDETTTPKDEDTTSKEDSKPTIIDGKLYFGRYPQTQVTATSSNGLSSITFNAAAWTDYGYYISSKVESFMYYKDVDTNKDGEYDYRGVYFTQYRPSFFRNESTLNNSFQDDRGYSTDTIYWFSYDSIKWDVLDTKDGKALIISNLELDSQEHNAADTKTEDGVTTYSNSYIYSYIRSFLNNEFYNTAFNALEKELIETTEVDNSTSITKSSTNIYTCENTNDKIFLLSYQEANTYYTTDSSRQTKTTDYTNCQGIYLSPTEETLGNASWWLRSPNDADSYKVDYVNFKGEISYKANGYTYGIRPACWINL